ncbi:UNVERIFIED_CONTAM: hypothetical protein Slati_4434900 [Sesamum latifolium]|uniref:Aminotransferase-like plant mobile domain-containing protein n=1 Tax=Sesamum latifolium TaxID=2727402 RepID=A0AAW2SRD3_9LAMI
MVYFKDKSSPSEVLLNKNVTVWTLRATHHELPRYQQSNDLIPLRTLGRSIIEGDAKWDGNLQFIGDFHYTKGYWEWTEDVLSHCGRRLHLISAYDAVYASLFTYDHNSDIIKAFCEAWCPFTNTLFTSAGELSISLWDLHDLAGLPITGCLYDEVVPSALELTGADEKGGRFIPRSSKYLLYAYHLLQGADDDQCSNSSIDKWVKFWSKKAIKYHLPPPRKEKKTVRPKSTHNPLGDITPHKRWSIAEEALFEKLCIEGNLKEEVYLTAYLACWLCTFVLPDKDVNSIRPSTFKMASMMASGRRVSLAIPVLTSIYEGLRGPKMTRFSGEGGAKYYDPQEARKRIHKAEFISWACNMIVKNRHFKFVDNNDAKELEYNYFVAIRSSYLTLRQSDKFIIEPYNPHRFGRQFGYFQDPKPTKITIKRKKHEDKQVDGENNSPHVTVPSIVVKSNSQAVAVGASKGKGPLYSLVDSNSSNKDRHWKRQKKELTPLKAVEASASRSPSADFVAQLEDEIHSIDASEESKTSHSWTTTPLPPFGWDLKESNFHSLLQFDFLSSFEDDVSLILESMKNFHKFDITKVEESLNTFFVKVRAYDEARSLSSQKLSRSLHEQHLKEAKTRLQDFQAKASEGASKVQSIVNELEHIEKEIVALKGRRTSLCAALKEQK